MADEKRRERDRKRYRNDPESRARQRARQNAWFFERYNDDPIFRIGRNLRTDARARAVRLAQQRNRLKEMRGPL